MQTADMRRTPHGVRGLKYDRVYASKKSAGSHPARGAWIEIQYCGNTGDASDGRTPHGVRGLKFVHRLSALSLGKVAPRTGCVD